ncbi:hypothetical protein [Wolbachia endosymbiont (group B) of Villa cingulata]|uniref:hypothetical protein n=1 Tax=Wolbachia endosymbiont (group B) of Villa cingulata TaxID=3066157 RepID=UPI003342C7BB
MPRWTDRHATILKKLQNIIKHPDSNTAAGRRLAIEKWVRTYTGEVEYLKDDELQFLYNVFRDENCWSGTRLNTATLGRMLTEEKIGEINNPLCKYNMACRYCMIDKIHPLFQKQLESYKSGFSSEEVDDDGRPATNNHKYVRNELLNAMNSEDPVLSFWIDKKSGEFKKHDNAVEGFNKAVEFKWSEGVEYFYRRINQKGKKKIDNLMVKAVANLSAIQANHNVATVLDFLLHEIITDPIKHKLLLELPDKGKGAMYQPLSTLIQCGFVDTVQDVIKHLPQKKVLVSEEKKILSHCGYAFLLSSLSNSMLEDPEIDIQIKARMIIVNLWKCDLFDEHKKAVVKFSKNIDPITDVLAGLIVDWQRDNSSNKIVKKHEVLEILQFIKDFCSDKDFKLFKDGITNDLKTVYVSGMKDGIDYSKVAEGLFSQLGKSAHLSPEGSGFSDPQTVLESAGVSGVSSRSYN